MATGDEVRKSFASDANTYSAGITARTIGGNAAQVLSSHITNKKIDALSSVHIDGASAAHTGSLASSGSGAAWVTSTAYSVGAIVTNSSVRYICTIAHTSGTFATDYAAAKWATFVDFGNSITVAVHGRFSAASAWCEIALALYDEANTLIGVTEKKVITADSSWHDGTMFLAPRVLFDIGEASQVRCVLKQGVSSGTVDVYIECL